jgi:enamine deaminase RidA (YjgF/YER057c/UK114 family)
MEEDRLVRRWPTGAPGRSRVVRHAGLVWTVANARTPSAPFAQQVAESLAMLDAHLAEAGSARSHVLSLQVLLSDIGLRGEFDRAWVEWIGADPRHWPQRACFQAALAPGLAIELIATAAAATAPLAVGAEDGQTP